MRLLFMSDTKRLMIEPCNKEEHEEACHPFSVLYKTVKHYKAAYADEQRSVHELVLYCWGLVHGICVLLASQQLHFEADYKALAEKIILSEKFL